MPEKLPGIWHYGYMAPRGGGYQPVCGFGKYGGTWYAHWATKLRGAVDCPDCMEMMGLPHPFETRDVGPMFVQEREEVARAWASWSESLTKQVLTKPHPFEARKWPPFKKGQLYVRDNVGVVWLLLPEYDNGMATTATAEGPWSVGINVLRNERGPLHILQLTSGILDQFPTILGDEDPS